MKKFLNGIFGLLIILIVLGLTLEGIGYSSKYFGFHPSFLSKRPSDFSRSERLHTLEQRFNVWKAANQDKLNPTAPVDFELRNEPAFYTDVGLHHKRSLWGNEGMLAANIDDDFRLLGSRSGREKWRVRYRTNSFGHRITTQEKKSHATHNLIFEGCSFTFGEGVIDEDTFPSRVGFYLPKIQTFNHGIQGSSPSRVLEELLKTGGSYLKDIDDKPAVVILTFIDDHLRRIIGSSARLIQHPNIINSEPYFSYSDGNLAYKDSFSEHPWKIFHLYRFLGDRAFVQAFNLEFPFIGESELVLVAKVIKAIEVEMKKTRPELKFFLAFYPGQHFYRNQLKPYLLNENITVLDYSEFDIAQKLGTQNDLGSDRHPSQLSHDLYAYLISEDLKELNL